MPRRVVAMSCRVCGAGAAMSEAVWVCPRRGTDDRRHVLGFVTEPDPGRSTPRDSANPFVRHMSSLAIDAAGSAMGLSETERLGIVESLDAAVAGVVGHGFETTPLSRADELSDALGFTAQGGIWVKDETHNVAGSHKARHLFTELVHLMMLEATERAPWGGPDDRPPLAIASCGNAAIAASTLARAIDWPIAVHVPEFSAQVVRDQLDQLGADTRVCPRLDTDPAGDPCVFRFRELVDEGAIAFGVQGTENVWCLDGGRTLGWELAEQWPGIDRVMVQAGGGAFASTVFAGLGEWGLTPRLHAVQAEGCAPLVRAWDKFRSDGRPVDVALRWSEYMWPWESTPMSFADGILDDETYDWLEIIDGAARSGGSVVGASEDNIVRAHRLAHQHTTIDVSPTGAAGLAGVLQERDRIADDERVLVVFSGRTR